MCNCALHDASPLVIESVTGAVTQQDRDPGSHFQIVVFCLFVCQINGSMLRFNGDFSIYNPFAQFNFWSMSPHCTGRIFNPTAHFTLVVLHFLLLSGQHAMVISALFWAWVHLWSALVAFRKIFQAFAAFHIKLCCISPSSRATHNDHFNSVLGLGAFMIWSNCI